MKVVETGFKGLVILEPPVHKDERGYFMESFNSGKASEQGITADFIQDNQSFSKAGVIRGLHFQAEPKAQAKLIRVLQGVILDVVVDLRRDQPTFRKTHVIELSKENNKQLLVPKGFAHGFSVLSETADVLYKCDEEYAPTHERGIRYDDPELNIDWRIPAGKRIISSKDLSLPLLKDLI